MGKNGRIRWYDVRVGLSGGAADGRQIKSVLLKARSPGQAARKIKGDGRILSVRKVSIQELFGVEDHVVNRMLDDNGNGKRRVSDFDLRFMTGDIRRP